jgi:hypothetical protein
VSTLASCGRLPATIPDLANRPRQLVFLTPIDSQLNDFLNEIHQIACFEPSIVQRIGGYAGGQAEYLRVPYADVGPIKIESDLPDEKVLFLSDIFPTGYMAAENAEIEPGDTVAVWGCGPVAQMAIQSCWNKSRRFVSYVLGLISYSDIPIRRVNGQPFRFKRTD